MYNDSYSVIIDMVLYKKFFLDSGVRSINFLNLIDLASYWF